MSSSAWPGHTRTTRQQMSGTTCQLFFWREGGREGGREEGGGSRSTHPRAARHVAYMREVRVKQGICAPCAASRRCACVCACVCVCVCACAFYASADRGRRRRRVRAVPDVAHVHVRRGARVARLEVPVEEQLAARGDEAAGRVVAPRPHLTWGKSNKRRRDNKKIGAAKAK